MGENTSLGVFGREEVGTQIDLLDVEGVGVGMASDLDDLSDADVEPVRRHDVVGGGRFGGGRAPPRLPFWPLWPVRLSSAAAGRPFWSTPPANPIEIKTSNTKDQQVRAASASQQHLVPPCIEAPYSHWLRLI